MTETWIVHLLVGGNQIDSRPTGTTYTVGVTTTEFFNIDPDGKRTDLVIFPNSNIISIEPGAFVDIPDRMPNQ